MTRASVCMTTFNAGRHLEAQIESILRQLEAHDELVVSDDGSTDGTLEFLSQYESGNVRIFKNGFRNVTKNFDFALHQARGQLIFLADQDDVWHAKKLARTIEELQRWDLVVSDCQVIDADGRLINPSYFLLNRTQLGFTANVWRNSYLGCCMAFRRQLLECALPIPAHLPHDMWIGLVAEMVAKPYLLREPLLQFRRHGATASYAAQSSRRSFYTKVTARLAITVALAQRYARCRKRATGLGTQQ